MYLMVRVRVGVRANPNHNRNALRVTVSGEDLRLLPFLLTFRES